MLRSALVLAVVVACSSLARADTPCPAVPVSPLPPVATKPASATSIAASRRAAKVIATEAAGRSGRFGDGKVCTLDSGMDGGWLQQLVLLDELVRHEPADFDTRAELLALTTTAVEQTQDTNCQVTGGSGDCCASDVCRAMRKALLAAEAQVRDQAYAGCKPCLGWLAAFRPRNLEDHLGKSADVARFVASLSDGPPGSLATATHGAIAALSLLWGAQDDDAYGTAIEKLAPYLGARTPPRLSGGGLSGRPQPSMREAPKQLTALQRADLRAIDTWMGAFMVGFPETGSVMVCDGHCCTWRFEDAHPHAFQITSVCFDAKLHLTAISTDLGGP